MLMAQWKISEFFTVLLLENRVLLSWPFYHDRAQSLKSRDISGEHVEISPHPMVLFCSINNPTFRISVHLVQKGPLEVPQFF